MSHSEVSGLGLGGVFSYRQILCADRVNGHFHLYARKTGHIYRTLDGGATWQRLNRVSQRIGNAPQAQAIAADRAVFGRVFVGTNGSGVWYGEPTAP